MDKRKCLQCNHHQVYVEHIVKDEKWRFFCRHCGKTTGYFSTHDGAHGGAGMTDQSLKDIDRAFKALEERDELLDKIRAEIEAKCCITIGRENDGAITLHDVFEIIDKYKAEGSENEK